jgi:hypothetical protein
VPFELRIGRRYLRPRAIALSFISLMSMLGVAIGVAVLIVCCDERLRGAEPQPHIEQTAHGTIAAFGPPADWQALRGRRC